MFGHRGSVIVPRVMALLQSMELRVPTKWVPEKLKKSMMPNRKMWER